MKKILSFLLLICLNQLMAQQANVSSGGNATGTNGSTSYTVGQVAYTNQTGTNGKVTQGVQQPFEIVTLAADDFPEISLFMTAFPNPTSANITLLIPNYEDENRKYELTDLNGRIIDSQKITDEETQITLGNLASAIYLLKVSNGNKLLKTFKIIKN